MEIKGDLRTIKNRLTKNYGAKLYNITFVTDCITCPLIEENCFAYSRSSHLYLRKNCKYIFRYKDFVIYECENSFNNTINEYFITNVNYNLHYLIKNNNEDTEECLFTFLEFIFEYRKRILVTSNFFITNLIQNKLELFINENINFKYKYLKLLNKYN